MTATTTGHRAEAAASAYLTAQGFAIIERNYRTPRCEIDIVARKDSCMYFVEVKYRVHVRQGSGLDYITTRKQQRMQYAAETWIREHDWQDEIALAAIEVSGPAFTVGTFIESIV